MDFAAMKQTVSMLHTRTGKSRLVLLGDILGCALKYGAGYRDYSLFRMYELTPAQRATCVTRGINNRLVARFNDPAQVHLLENKVEFNRHFAPFVHRQWLSVEEATPGDVQGFLREYGQIFYKPATDTCGQGIRLLQEQELAEPETLLRQLVALGPGLLEAPIRQHPVLMALYPHCVNSCRICTLRTGGKVHVVYAFLRMGKSGRYVDNLNAGGLAAPVELDTGVVSGPGCDKADGCYRIHPVTGQPIVGLQLPFWQETVAMCRQAAETLSGLNYVGWDVALTEQGPQLIEGNHFPGHDILQLPGHMPGGVGMLPRFLALVPDLWP